MKRFLLLTIFLLAGWIIWDLCIPQKTNLKVFQPSELARLDAAMWRSYYERKPLQLFKQSVELMCTQMQAPFWRSVVMAYDAAKAAFVFKDGKNRTDYAKALPYLEGYYGHINDLSDKPFDVKKAAQQELEWWIIRRYREQHPPEEWAQLQANIAHELYGQPQEQFLPYARLRTQAMLMRDSLNTHIAEKDWQAINQLLNNSWTALHQAVQPRQ